MASELQLFVLGRPRIERDGQPLADLVSAKAQALLIYLALTRKTYSRSALAGLLWGDMPEETARANLRLALTKLRKVVGDHLAISWQDVALNTNLPYHVDAAELLAGAGKPEQRTTEQLRSALSLYRGDFLDDFPVQNAPDFESWALVERERLRQIALNGWRHLAAEYRAHGVLAESVEATRQVLALDPWDEEAHQQLMWLLASSGQRSAALAHYEVCRHVLAEELGVDPAPATVALYEQIKREVGAVDVLLPPIATIPARPSAPKLPISLTPLVGRQTERAQIIDRLANPECRLLTLIGPGGIGKTRLALAAAEGLAHTFADGVAFVSVVGRAAQRNGEVLDLLVASIAAALGYTFAAQQSPRDLLQHYLADKALLLILDNMEQLRAASKMLAELLRRAPNVKLLVTSRERLGVAGEWLYEVQGLAYAPVRAGGVHAGYPAFDLFVQAARRVQPGFDPSAEAAAINGLCRLVEGSPLGIELAAGWVRVLGCAEIVARLERSLDLLSATAASVDDRHHSMRAVLDDSWAMLSADERRVFWRLSVFQGGFDLAAAEQVAEATPPVLAAVADKSWLRRGDDGRYQIHELLRQYGTERLGAEEEERAATRRRHAQYYAGFLLARRPALDDRTDPSGLAELDPEIDNLRAAWEWLRGQANAVSAVGYLEGLWRYYERKGWFAEAVFTLEQAVQLPGVADPRRGRWQRWLGEACYQIGRIVESEEHLTQALRLLGERVPQTQSGWALHLLRHVSAQAAHRVWLPKSLGGDPDCQQPLLDASAALSQLGPIWYQSGDGVQTLSAAFWSLNLAERAGASPELARAYAGCCITTGSMPLHRLAAGYAQLALAAARSGGDPATQAYVLELVGLYHVGIGRWAEAQAMLEQARALFARLELPRGEIEALSLLAKAHYFRGQFNQAQQTHTTALRISQSQADGAGEHWNLLGLSECALRTASAPSAHIGAWLERAGAVQHTRSLAHADVLRYYGTSALSLLQCDDDTGAAEAAQTGARLIERNTFAGAWTLEGFAGVAETYLALWEAAHHRQGKPADREVLADAARRACNAMRAFARVFSIAQPRAWLYHGWRDWLSGAPARANRAWRRGLEIAEQLAMPYEQGRAHYELGRHAASHDQRQEHLRRALEIFATLDAGYDQTRAAHALEAAPKDP
jgi:DNA-binding SARP family transcriptional activator/predicted ATPase